nr:helix-turn-helix domain-containing protein [Acidobacteriota bacterium]
RFESAIAMLPTTVRRASRRDFLAEVDRASARDTLLRHVAMRLAERQTAVFDLVTMASEYRLAKVLLTFAEKLGTIDGDFLRLGQRISHEELSQIVGTTRPRITAFMQRFRALGLIETGGRSISVHRTRIRAFLGRE